MKVVVGRGTNEVVMEKKEVNGRKEKKLPRKEKPT